MRFENKVVIVTGGNSGIGLATAKRFGFEGARVVIVSRSAAESSAVAEVKKCGARDSVGISCDVAKEEAVECTVAETINRFGQVDVIVNNAGLMIFAPLEKMAGHEFQRVLNVNLVGAFYFIKQAFQRMKPGGAIVNVSSIHALETQALVSAYAASKAALISLTRSAAIEGKDKGIRVNVVLPGAVDTPMLRNNPKVKSGEEHLKPTDVGRPEDLAAVIAFLASDEARFVQGAALTVDGGRLGTL